VSINFQEIFKADVSKMVKLLGFSRLPPIDIKPSDFIRFWKTGKLGSAELRRCPDILTFCRQEMQFCSDANLIVLSIIDFLTILRCFCF